MLAALSPVRDPLSVKKEQTKLAVHYELHKLIISAWRNKWDDRQGCSMVIELVRVSGRPDRSGSKKKR